jgi:hypothetical protein
MEGSYFLCWLSDHRVRMKESATELVYETWSSLYWHDIKTNTKDANTLCGQEAEF